MLKNYITIAINNLLKNKLYSAINIVGLAIGLAACLIITLYVQNELSYDKHWKEADLIYRINKVINSGDQSAEISLYTSFMALPALKNCFPDDIEFGTRIIEGGGRFKIGDTFFPVSYAKVDKDFINVFNVEAVKGDLKSTLQYPNNIALSEESANKYFGNRDPIGEVITDNEIQYKVTAVYRLPSSKTVMNIPGFLLLEESQIPKMFQSWNSSWPETYIRFYKTADIKDVVDRLPDFINKTIPADIMRLQPGQKLSDVRGYSLQKINDIYFNPLTSSPSWEPRAGNKIIITVYTTISILVLIIACINFITLTTANATQRAHEVAVRKVVGARYKQLLIQFLGESLLITLIAFLIAAALIEIALPVLDILMDIELSVSYMSPLTYIFALILVTTVGLSGGLYPSLFLSRFSPSRVLNANRTTEGGVSSRLRSVLLVFQFTASIVLIIATVVVYFQLLHTANHDPGFNPDNLIVVKCAARENISKYRKTLQQELMKLPQIINTCLSNRQPMELGGGFNVKLYFRRRELNSKPGQAIRFKNNLYVDYNFFKTYEIPLLSGRSFTQEMDQEEAGLGQYENDKNKAINTRQIIINFAAARQLGYASADKAVGETLLFGDAGTADYMEYSIIGVAGDSQYRSLRVKPEPEIYHLSPDSGLFLAVRYHGDYKTVAEKIRSIWQKIAGEDRFIYSNVKQNMATTFVQEEKENKALISFALLAVFLACMGLFGIAAFTVDRRVKEIGVRKVMGAKVKDIVKLLGWNFLKPVLIANIIAWPVAVFAMQNWLQHFPYRFNQLYMIPICLASCLLALSIAWVTVAGNTTRMAKSNPIKALRYE